MKYIFEVTINPGCRMEDYVRAWKAESEIIQRQPGARGTRLHRLIGCDGKLLAIASWESKAMRDAAFDRLKDDDKINEIRKSHEHLVEFHLIGEFEDPDWIVLPPDTDIECGD